MPDGRTHIHTDVDSVEFAKFKSIVAAMDGKLKGTMGKRLDDAIKLFNQRYTNLTFTVSEIEDVKYERKKYRADQIHKFKDIMHALYHHKNYPDFHPMVVLEVIKICGVVKDKRALKFYLNQVELHSILKDVDGTPFTIRDVTGYIKWVKKEFK